MFWKKLISTDIPLPITELMDDWLVCKERRRELRALADNLDALELTLSKHYSEQTLIYKGRVFTINKPRSIGRSKTMVGDIDVAHIDAIIT